MGRQLQWLLVALGGTACTLPQAEACADYVRCQEAVDASVDTGPWEEDGSCWALPDTARRCEGQCRAALEGLLALPNPPPECLSAS